jgi:hypothetical protein
MTLWLYLYFRTYFPHVHVLPLSFSSYSHPFYLLALLSNFTYFLCKISSFISKYVNFNYGFCIHILTPYPFRPPPPVWWLGEEL